MRYISLNAEALVVVGESADIFVVVVIFIEQ